MLLKHMPEVNALQFLHDVVDVCHLDRKLKKNFPDGKVVEEVPLCVLVGDMMGLGIMWKNTVFLQTQNHFCTCKYQWSALGLLSQHLNRKGLATVSWCLTLSHDTSSPRTTGTH